MANKISDKEIDKISKETGDKLRVTDKVKIKIPVDKMNKHEDTIVVGINGFNYLIKKGESVEVPEEVARILEEAGHI